MADGNGRGFPGPMQGEAAVEATDVSGNRCFRLEMHRPDTRIVFYSERSCRLVLPDLTSRRGRI
jgi:hypothetical protein